MAYCYLPPFSYGRHAIDLLPCNRIIKPKLFIVTKSAMTPPQEDRTQKIVVCPGHRRLRKLFANLAHDAKTVVCFVGCGVVWRFIGFWGISQMTHSSVFCDWCVYPRSREDRCCRVGPLDVAEWVHWMLQSGSGPLDVAEWVHWIFCEFIRFEWMRLHSTLWEYFFDVR